MSDLQPMPAWHAIHCHCQHEYRVQNSLSRIGIEEFLPTYRTRVYWSHHTKEVDRVLFPGYVFGRFERQAIPEIIRIGGVIQLCGGNLRPAHIADHEIHGIRSVLSSMLPLQQETYSPGELVLIRRGPFQGVTGRVVRVKNKLRLYVAIEMLQRAVSVELAAEDLRKVA